MRHAVVTCTFAVVLYLVGFSAAAAADSRLFAVTTDVELQYALEQPTVR